MGRGVLYEGDLRRVTERPPEADAVARGLLGRRGAGDRPLRVVPPAGVAVGVDGLRADFEVGVHPAHRDVAERPGLADHRDRVLGDGHVAFSMCEPCSSIPASPIVA